MKHARDLVVPRTAADAVPVDGMARERDWLVPSALMTAMLGLAALLLMPIAGYEEIPPYFDRFIIWMKYMLLGLTLVMMAQLVKLHRAGVAEPFAHIKAQFLAKKSALLAALAGAILGGIDMLFFMWIKPEVTAISPFWADELFADIDHAIFQTDPWRLFQNIDLTVHAWAYSFLWAMAIMATLVWLLAQKPSFERSASLLSYFALWSIFGPIGQFLLSSAGPIFYQRIGLGDRFADLGGNIPQVTHMVSGYLWNHHSGGTLGVGAGISAMPSLHIATAAWITLAFRGQRSRLTPLTGVFVLYIWALSVALGWHYAVDGIVGAAGAVMCHWACAAWLRGREQVATIRQPMPAPSLGQSAIRR
jgi:hypothetical protein